MNPAKRGFAGRARSRTLRKERRLLSSQTGAHADGYDLDSAVRIRIAVHALVFFVERRGGIASVPRYRQLVALARIANIGGADKFGAACIFSRDPLQALEFTLEIGTVQDTRGMIADMI